MKRILIALLLAFTLTANPAVAKKPTMTPMELQAIQSREFEVGKEVAFGAIMTVIQDLGYTVASADIASGFITAASPTENKTGILDAFAGQRGSGNTVMTAFLLQMPSGTTRIRLNFVNSKSTSGLYGRSDRRDKPILDPNVYQNAWERIDEALFVMGALADRSDKKAEPAAQTATPSAKPSDIGSISTQSTAGSVKTDEE